ncbi:MAG: iron uptake porin [Xenococcaceae cyanobacterium MO_188.B29]|nr:iron uptake porin [Xenococcaceae cyanobacterium MO_188.B29]
MFTPDLDLNTDTIRAKQLIQLESQYQGQISMTSVYQLSDVKASDWAFQAWKSLAQRYDCPTNNLSLAKLNNSVISRAEFAVGLNTCLNHFLSKLDQIKSTASVDDLRVWERLQTDFATELAAFNSKVGNLENRTQTLEDNLFSTTTQLRGEVLFQLADSFGSSIDSDEDETQTLFGSRPRLNFLTSFTGSDVLRTRIGTSNIGRLNQITGTVMTRLGAEGDDEGAGSMEVTYRFLAGERTAIGVGTSGAGVQQAAEVLNPLSSSSRGAISRFGRRDPATLRGAGSAGVTIQHEFSDRVQGGIGYSTGDAESPDEGLFNGSYSAIAQIVVQPTDFLELAFAYNREYQSEGSDNLMGDTGSENANNPFDENAMVANHLGFQFNWYVNDGLEFGGWFGYTQAQQKQNGSQEATILNGALNFTFPDLGSEGNVGGIIIGIPPIVTNHDNADIEDEKTSWHLEALYRIRVTDNIEITPGFFVVTDPNHEDNDAIWVGTIRARFGF